MMNKTESNEAYLLPARRRFLRQLAGGTVLAVAAPGMAAAALKPLRLPTHKTIAFENANTGDKLKLTYFEHGRYIEAALREISFLCRDYHTGAVHPVDPLLLDQVHDLIQVLGIDKPIHVISGYRSPLTNAHLRNHSHGVAKHSLHMEGRAIDIRIPGLSSRHIRNAAVAMGRGGVGYYPHADFVHLDTGDVRIW